MIREHEMVVLTCDLPEHGLRSGDMCTVVHVHRDAAAFGVEFMTLDGETIAVLSLAKEKVRPVGPGEIHHARSLESRA